MKTKEFKGFLKEFGFLKYADIVSIKGRASFSNFQANWSDYGYVYVWVEKDKLGISIVYVGKAGKTMRARCNQHESGFRGGSKKGKTHSNRIVAGILAGKRYSVYARKSASQTLLGVPDVSLGCIEELAFIRKLSPPWNSITS